MRRCNKDRYCSKLFHFWNLARGVTFSQNVEICRYEIISFYFFLIGFFLFCYSVDFDFKLMQKCITCHFEKICLVYANEIQCHHTRMNAISENLDRILHAKYDKFLALLSNSLEKTVLGMNGKMKWWNQLRNKHTSHMRNSNPTACAHFASLNNFVH